MSRRAEEMSLEEEPAAGERPSQLREELGGSSSSSSQPRSSAASRLSPASTTPTTAVAACARGLDFMQLTPQLLAMRPPWQLQSNAAARRNNVDDVARYLDNRFDNHYQIFCLDRAAEDDVGSNSFSKFHSRALLFRTADSLRNLRAPPALGLICHLCNSALYWQCLDRGLNVCVLQVQDSSVGTLLVLIAMLLALDVVIGVDEALGYMRKHCAVEEQAHSAKQAGTFTYSEPSSWMPSARRYLGYLRTLYSDGNARSRCIPQSARFCLTLISVERFVSYVDDLLIEVYTCSHDEHSKACGYRLLADSKSYIVQHCDAEAGTLLLQTSPPGQQPLWVEGDVAIVVRLASNRSCCCRYFFHTSFISPGRTDFLELGNCDFDMDRESTVVFPDNLSVKLVLSSSAPRQYQETREDAAMEQQLISSPPCCLPISQPRADREAFSRAHVVHADHALVRELEEAGFEGADAAIALQLNENGFIKALKHASAHFPVSEQSCSWKLSSAALLSRQGVGCSSCGDATTEPPLSEEAETEADTEADVDTSNISDASNATKLTQVALAMATRCDFTSTASTGNAARPCLASEAPSGISSLAEAATADWSVTKQDVELNITRRRTTGTALRRPPAAATSYSGRSRFSLRQRRFRRPGDSTGAADATAANADDEHPANADEDSGEGANAEQAAPTVVKPDSGVSARIQRVPTPLRLVCTAGEDAPASEPPMPAVAASEQAVSTAKQVSKGSGKGKAPPPPPPKTHLQGNAPPHVTVAKGDGKGKAPPLPSTSKGDGKGKAPPPPLGKAEGKGGLHGKGKNNGKLGTRGANSSAASTTAAGASLLPLGRKFHWKPLAEEQLQNTVWAELDLDEVQESIADPPIQEPQTTSEQHAGPSFEVLERIFKAAKKDGVVTQDAKGVKKRLRQNAQTTILDDRRAQNIAIIMCGLGFDPSELCSRLRLLNTSGLSLDSLEKCKEILPTDEEAKQLAAFRGDPASLRDVEQRLFPLCFLSRLPQRLQFMVFDVQLQQSLKEVQEGVRLLLQATAQVRGSKQLRRILKVVLVLGNFVNHGATAGRCPTKGFTVESLPRLLELKSPVHTSVTMLHYVVHRVLTSASTDHDADAPEAQGAAAAEGQVEDNDRAAAAVNSTTCDSTTAPLRRRWSLAAPGAAAASRPRRRSTAANSCQAATTQVAKSSHNARVMEATAAKLLREELDLVGSASRVSQDALRSQQASLAGQMAALANELRLSSKYEPEAITAMQRLQAVAEEQLNEFTAQFSECERALVDLLHFFGEDPKKTTAAGLFASLHIFVELFSKVAEELCRSPARFQVLLGCHGTGEQTGAGAVREEGSKDRSTMPALASPREEVSVAPISFVCAEAVTSQHSI